LRGRVGHSCRQRRRGRPLLAGLLRRVWVEDFGTQIQGRADVDGLNGAEDEGQRGDEEDEAVGGRDRERDWGGHCWEQLTLVMEVENEERSWYTIRNIIHGRVDLNIAFNLSRSLLLLSP
jgi:hypothetical protein